MALLENMLGIKREKGCDQKDYPCEITIPAKDDQLKVSHSLFINLLQVLMFQNFFMKYNN
jgi:hypothetical protein